MKLSPSEPWKDKPYGEFRVSKTHGPETYFYWRPKAEHAKMLEGWQFHFDGWRCSDPEVVKAFCERANLTMPSYETTYCYKIYYEGDEDGLQYGR